MRVRVPKVAGTFVVVAAAALVYTREAIFSQYIYTYYLIRELGY